MTEQEKLGLGVTRRHFMQDCRIGLGAMALGTLMSEDGLLL